MLITKQKITYLNNRKFINIIKVAPKATYSCIHFKNLICQPNFFLELVDFFLILKLKARQSFQFQQSLLVQFDSWLVIFLQEITIYSQAINTNLHRTRWKTACQFALNKMTAVQLTKASGYDSLHLNWTKRK